MDVAKHRQTQRTHGALSDPPEQRVTQFRKENAGETCEAVSRYQANGNLRGKLHPGFEVQSIHHVFHDEGDDQHGTFGQQQTQHRQCDATPMVA